MSMIQTVNLTRRYGEVSALTNLNLVIDEGECFGYIGPNGAGKTTTIRILATLLQPTWGEARIAGHVVGYESHKIRPLIGYMPDFFGTYEDMVVAEYLAFFAAAYGMTGEKRTKVVADVMELTDLTGHQAALVDGLSRGMKQRLSLARVLLHDPKVLLLDEPASGLDPRARVEMRELLKELKRMGKTILISSHILHELAELCTSVGILEQGELVFSGSMTDLVRKAQPDTTVRLQIRGQGHAAVRALENAPGVHRVRADKTNGDLRVWVSPDAADYTFILRPLLAAGIGVITLQREEINLEQAFMRLTKGLVQ